LTESWSSVEYGGIAKSLSALWMPKEGFRLSFDVSKEFFGHGQFHSKGSICFPISPVIDLGICHSRKKERKGWIKYPPHPRYPLSVFNKNSTFKEIHELGAGGKRQGWSLMRRNLILQLSLKLASRPYSQFSFRRMRNHIRLFPLVPSPLISCSKIVSKGENPEILKILLDFSKSSLSVFTMHRRPKMWGPP